MCSRERTRCSSRWRSAFSPAPPPGLPSAPASASCRAFGRPSASSAPGPTSPRARTLTAEMIAVREIPAQFVTDSYIKVDSQGAAEDSPVGQRVARPAQGGRPASGQQFETTRRPEPLHQISPKGRAVTIDVRSRARWAAGCAQRPRGRARELPRPRQRSSSRRSRCCRTWSCSPPATSPRQPPDPRGREEVHDVSLLVLPEEAEMLVLARSSARSRSSAQRGRSRRAGEARGRATRRSCSPATAPGSCSRGATGPSRSSAASRLSAGRRGALMAGRLVLLLVTVGLLPHPGGLRRAAQGIRAVPGAVRRHVR